MHYETPSTVIRQALILKFGQIGDVIMALPAVYALHRQGYAVTWVCGRAALPLLECYEWIAIVPVDGRAILRGGTVERLRHILKLWREVAVRRYDLCATLYYDSRFKLLALPVRAKRKFKLSLTDRDYMLLPGRHHTDEYARILLGWTDECRDRSTVPVRPDRLPPSPLPEKSAARRIAVVPGGTSNVLGEQVLRRWQIDRYVELVRRLLERGWEVVLSGGPEDAWVREHFTGLAVTDTIGTLRLPEVVSLFDSCDAVITHDTGPLHLAGLSTATIVSVFGPTDPAARVPRRPFAVGIWGGEGFSCRPCYDGREFAPCPFNGCMYQVRPELVLEELDRMLTIRDRGESDPWHVVHPSS